MHDTLLYFIEHSAFVGRVMDPTLAKLYPHITLEASQEEFVRGEVLRTHRQFSFRDHRAGEDRIDASRAVDWLHAPRTILSGKLAEDWPNQRREECSRAFV
ncbi:hypothetical protein AURDEDRAFT_163779 [Auricularia subglabra TFB-10046 SS5]|nr:hypothetical protein AURDEDRAFT_163779 [Auricularia subglabra TFB-10046 SS5]